MLQSGAYGYRLFRFADLLWSWLSSLEACPIPVALLPASAAPATAPLAAPAAAPARTLPTTLLALLKIPADDFDLPDFLPAFFLVVAPLDFLEPERLAAVPLTVDFFFVVFLVAIGSLCSFDLSRLTPPPSLIWFLCDTFERFAIFLHILELAFFGTSLLFVPFDPLLCLWIVGLGAALDRTFARTASGILSHRWVAPLNYPVETKQTCGRLVN
jgi:hypothetical protein